MTLFKPQEIGCPRLPAQAIGPMRESTAAASAVLIPFPGPEARRTCRIPRSGERRGEILLFLGVRYERLAS
ncbi:hypothetical protein GOFOIKOB_2033 [Methylobacterium tardum]|mgnify:CR=1 FL=1|jgi:hypothetical protein|uniref:Uncharacterized protein n=1 Tax=Methylobacterium tardum TaxID=374432 RepID=A0AA37WWJ5_9HYPH|nr:hypothetical protein [Methylobacterium tardum]URD39140.1 hypothetical protein M6G65_12460 [Methylobacterium tardum]GJE48999.1 hypothetical protein GOFOIKOB_2033 [Methylobacterium tardum]GLS74142.1 hypothetical protein GCM10007890_61570 [Methylobacterium tardum]